VPSVQGRQMPLFMEPLLLKIPPDLYQACCVLQPWRGAADEGKGSSPPHVRARLTQPQVGLPPLDTVADKAGFRKPYLHVLPRSPPAPRLRGCFFHVGSIYAQGPKVLLVYLELSDEASWLGACRIKAFGCLRHGSGLYLVPTGAALQFNGLVWLCYSDQVMSKIGQSVTCPWRPYRWRPALWRSCTNSIEGARDCPPRLVRGVF